MGITAMVASLAVGAAATGYSAYQSNQANSLAKKQAQQATDAANALQQTETNNQNQAAMLIQKRRAMAGNGTALQDTILTGPSGVPATSGGSGQKTLLGM